jgi:RimJ/RimL family protein N-acetyltransferase
VDWEHRRGALSIWLAPQARGQGLAGPALRLTGEWLLQTTQLLRLEVIADPDNAPMVRAARSAGFVSEGVLRGYHREHDRRVDAAVLSLLPTDVTR